MKMKRIFREIAAVIVLPLALGGCSFFNPAAALREQDEADAAMEDLINVGFSQLGSESAWRTANTESVQNTLTEKNGYFLLYDNARQSQQNQIKALRSYISQRVDVIVFCPVQETGWDTVMAEAKKAGIPVIVLDRSIEADDSLYTTFVGEDNREEGIRIGEWLEDYLDQQGKGDDTENIVVLKGTEGSSPELGRSMGFNAIAARNPNWKILAQAGAEFTQAKGKEVMARFLEEFDDIDVVVAQNDDMAIGALEAIQEAGKTAGVDGDMIVLSFDGTKNALELVQKGQIAADMECNPLSGPLLSDVIQKIVNGEQVEKEYYMEEMLFTEDNVGRYIDGRVY